MAMFQSFSLDEALGVLSHLSGLDSWARELVPPSRLGTLSILSENTARAFPSSFLAAILMLGLFLFTA